MKLVQLATAAAAFAGASAQVTTFTREVHIKSVVGPKSEASTKKLVGAADFMPMPPPIECDDMWDDNGISCIYIASNTTVLVTDLSLGNVTMPDNNPDFVVSPPATIGAEGGWFSFHTLYSASDQTFQAWSGEVQYTAKDSAGNTYIFSVTLDFGPDMIDMGFMFPQWHGIDVTPEVFYDPEWATGFQITDK